jgi:hypothetical protein
MDAGAMIHIQNFIETGSGIQKLMGEDSQTHRHTHTQMHRQHADHINLL